KVLNERIRLLGVFAHGSLGAWYYSGLLQLLFLPQAAYAVGKTLAELPLEKLKIRIHTIRRDGEVIVNPVMETQLQASVIVVLSGEPGTVEVAEGYLLAGK